MAGEKIVQQALKAVRELNPLGLFSRATEEASKIPQAKGTPQQMRAALLKQGVKPDELKWTGFDDWAKGRQSVTRDEVADFLRRNEVRVDESVLGYNPRVASLEARKQEIDSEIEAIVAREIAAGRVPAEHPQYKALSDEYYDIIDNRMSREEPTKFERYTFPGGENYRELLLKRPEVENDEPARFSMLGGQGMRRVDPNNYLSEHYPDPNILAHLRLKDRTDPEGRRILHVEEIQSDWAQEGRKRGFNDSPAVVDAWKAERDAVQRQLQQAADAINSLRGEAPRFQPGKMSPREYEDMLNAYYDNARNNPEFTAMLSRRDDLVNQVREIDSRKPSFGGVPSAPFVESTPKWTDLALKRALREAAEGNYDALAWTPGAPQAARYPGGGEKREAGMRKFYDEIVPQQLQKLVRPMDPNAQLGTVSIPTPVRDARTTRLSDSELMAELSSDAPAPQARQLPSLNITPTMREKIKEGLPLFTMVPGAVGLGMAQPGQEEPREGFDKGGVVKKALKAVADLFNTPEMEKWRGKSVIPSSRVEDRYFHGTSKDKDFPQFNVGRHGVWLTKNPEEASEYALQNDSMGLRPGPGWSYEKTNTASRVIPVFARAENPYTGALPDFAMSPNYKRAQSEWFDQLRSQGHDAWLPESNPDLAVILRDPEQIKSAISNTGEFSGPRIDRAEGGRLLEDQYPTQYLPNVGRQVMADGGETAQSRRRATLEQLGAFEDRPVMDPATMGENWASAVRRFRERPLREGEATVRPLELGGRDVLGGAIAGDGGIVRSRIADIVAGSRGLPGSGTLGMGVADLTPAGIPLAVSDFSDALRNEDYLSAGLSAGLPAAYYARKPIMAAGRAVYDAGARAVDTARDVLGRVPAPVAAGGAGAAVMMPEEAEAGKSRMVQQVLDLVRTAERPASSRFMSQAGEYGFHVPESARARDPRKQHSISSTVLSRPLGEMHAVQAITDEGIPRRFIDPSSLEGASLIPAIGDRTASGARLMAVNETPLAQPVELQGGHGFMYGPAARGPDRAVWASDAGVIKTLANKVREEANAGFDPYLSYVAMGSRSGDYSHHMTDALLGLLPSSKAKAATIKEFDNQMRTNTANKWAPYADWPGLKSPNLQEYLYGGGPGKARTKVAELMGQSSFQGAGMPDVGAARFAITDPSLLHAADYSAGRTIAKLDPSGRIIYSPAVPHKSYRHQLAADPEVGYVGGFEYDVPMRVINKEWIDDQISKKPQLADNDSQLAYSYRMSAPAVRMTPEVVDRLSTYMDLKRRGLIP